MSLNDPRINHFLITTTNWQVTDMQGWCQGNTVGKRVIQIPWLSQSQVISTLQLTSGYPLAYLTSPAHPAGEITVKINYHEHHTINSTDRSYGLVKPENRVAVAVGAEIFLLTTAFSPVHPACCPMVQVSEVKRQGVIPITHFHPAPK
jgi:hypothetical protein